MQDISELQKAIQIYFDAIYFCDVKLLDQVFHPASSLFDGDNDGIFVEPIASFRADVGARQSPASRDQQREDEITLIDWLSKDCALVKIRLRAHESIFLDHLCFVRGNEGWQIVAKVWHLERLDAS